jgi:hypothetical protein
MPRGALVVDAKLLKDHYLRQQHGGNTARYRGRGYGIGGIIGGYEIGGIFRALRDMLSLYSNKVLKLLAKENYKLRQKSVKIIIIFYYLNLFKNGSPSAQRN